VPALLPADADTQRTPHRVANESERDGALQVLQQAIHRCRLCTGLPGIAVPKVHGSAGAHIMVVGQALSLAESIDPAVRPFDDATGRTLRRWLGVDEATFYDPDLVYLTALGKCFPGKAPGGGDLPPRRECYAGDGHGGGDWLRQELALLRPQLIVTLGACAFRYFEPGDGPHTPHVGVARRWREAILFPLPHPSGANRAWHVRNRRQLEEAIAAVRPLVRAALD
jgi:uracil-DNA glycosylase